MGKKDYSEGSDETSKRAKSLRELSQYAPLAQQGILQEVFAELDAAIEELRVAEEELRQQNQELIASRDIIEQERYRYQALFEFAPVAYLVTDTFGVINEANSAAAILLNMSARYLKGKPLASFILEEKRRAFRIELLNFQTQDYIPEWELQLQPRRTASFDVSATVATVRDESNTVTGLRWVLQDIMERKPGSTILEEAP